MVIEYVKIANQHGGFDSVDYLLGGSLTLRNGRIDQYHLGRSASRKGDAFVVLRRKNIRQVTKADGSTKGKVIQKVSYYPFGLQLCDGTTDSNVQSHKYNGKELDKMHGLNTYDYGARQYNPVTARWDRIDPLAEKYYSISPYAYCANNPVKYVDPDGRDYRLIFDFENQTITVYANYDVATGAEAEFKKAQDYWNNKEFEKNGCTIKFKITSDADEKGKFLNTFAIAGAKGEVTDYAITLGGAKGNAVTIYDGADKNTSAHEVGHTLGLTHYDERNNDAEWHLMYFNSGERRDNQLDYSEVSNDVFASAQKGSPTDKHGVANIDYDRESGESVKTGICRMPPTFVKNQFKKMKQAIKSSKKQKK